MIKLKCVLMRGGTSKAVFFHEKELPSDPKLRDKVVLDVFGSPDIREIDGLGGSDGSTCKPSIISRYYGLEADVGYNFGHAMFDEPLVSYGLNCGSISAAVGPFGVDEGIVKEHSADVDWPVEAFCAIIMPPCNYTTIQGEKIREAEMSLRAIIWAAHQYHPACSGRICASTGVGALIPCTVVKEVLVDYSKKTGEIRIGHPSVIMECDAEVEMKDGQSIPKKAAYYLTARRIMEG